MHLIIGYLGFGVRVVVVQVLGRTMILVHLDP